MQGPGHGPFIYLKAVLAALRAEFGVTGQSLGPGSAASPPKAPMSSLYGGVRTPPAQCRRTSFPYKGLSRGPSRVRVRGLHLSGGPGSYAHSTRGGLLLARPQPSSWPGPPPAAAVLSLREGLAAQLGNKITRVSLFTHVLLVHHRRCCLGQKQVTGTDTSLERWVRTLPWVQPGPSLPASGVCAPPVHPSSELPFRGMVQKPLV